MEQRDLGVQADYVERAFKRVEVLPECAPMHLKEYFLTRALQLQDLAHIQANRPLARPGRPGWRSVPSPHCVARQEQRAAMFQKRLADERSSLESMPDIYGKWPRGGFT